MSIKKLRKDLLSGKINLSTLEKYKDELIVKYSELMSINILSEEEFDELEDLIMLFLDYYNYSETGEVLISDHEYDLLMNHYIANGGSLISRSDTLQNQTQWKFIEHESPGIVGSIKKIYTFEELYVWWKKFCEHGKIRSFRIAPKFDGISSAIKITNHNGEGVIKKAVTRNDGIVGQDITKMVSNTKNGKSLAVVYGSNIKNGESIWIKTELVINTIDFGKLNEDRDGNGDKKYANRRSATSGIVNTPKNLKYAKYVTVIPLAAHYLSNDMIEYTPMDSKIIGISEPLQLMEAINMMLSKIRDASYPIRTDGVVLYPLGEDIIPNYDDIMDNAIAYKVNTEEALTTIEYGYVSVGRLGNAIPMLHVTPVEVNETIVQDVSLGSFDKFMNMGLYEGEQVVIYSAGNVIPQAKLPEHRNYRIGADYLRIKKRCPFCGEKLTRYKNSYKCSNPRCPRVNSGKISNFVIKLDAENVSDKTIEDLVENGLIKTIPDIFYIEEADIERLDGYGKDSARMIVGEFQKIKTRPIPISTLLGSLGIQGISEKKCKNLLKNVNWQKLLRNPKKLKFDLTDSDNVGMKTASIFTDFIDENASLIQELLDIMNIVNDVSYKGNVVFTGFRDSELEAKFNNIGYEVSNNVNSDTVAVIDASYSHDSTKCKSAKKKGIDIVYKGDVNEVLRELMKG